MSTETERKEHPVTRIIRGATTAILILCLLAGGILVLPRALQIEPYIVLSGSMEPTIPTCSVAFIDRKDRKADEGVVIAFTLSSGEGQIMVTHRVTRTEGDLIYTKGDANDSEDVSPLRPEQVVGTCVFHVPVLGYVLGTVDKRMLAAFVLLILVINLFFSRERRTRE